MSAGFTPGPWSIYAQPIESGQQAKDELALQVDHTSPIGPTLYLIDAGGKCAATTGCGPTSEANASLIAAAPTMDEVLAECELAFDKIIQAQGCRPGHVAYLSKHDIHDMAVRLEQRVMTVRAQARGEA